MHCSHLLQGKKSETPVRVLDLGSGKGGAARWLAKTYGCHVTCFNLGQKQNEFNKAKKADIMLGSVKQQEEVLEYRKDIVAHIAARELQGRAYLNWLSYFDDNCAEYYVQAP